MGKRIALVLGVVAMVILAAGGGFFYGRSVGQAQSNRARQQFAQGRFQGQNGQFPDANGTPQPGQQGSGRQGGGTVGTIEAIEGDTLVVKTQDSSIRVKTTDTTLIEKLSSVGVSDLKTGEQVMVSGSKNDDGSVTARSIQSLRGSQTPRSNQP